MKRRLVLWAVDRSIAVIGQIRRDSALFRIPEPPAKRQRGRPKKYGDRITSADMDALPVTQKQTSAYGGRLMRWCGITCRPRFLRGLDVRVVRISMRTNKGWTKDRLVLSTDTTLGDEDIIIGYSRRWPTEPLYRDLKFTEGLREMWMQARKTLMRWLHVVQTGAALAIMLSAKTDPELDALARIGGWRKEIKPSTPGLVKQALAGALSISRPCRFSASKRDQRRKTGVHRPPDRLRSVWWPKRPVRSDLSVVLIQSARSGGPSETVNHVRQNSKHGVIAPAPLASRLSAAQ